MKLPRAQAQQGLHVVNTQLPRDAAPASDLEWPALSRPCHLLASCMPTCYHPCPHHRELLGRAGSSLESCVSPEETTTFFTGKVMWGPRPWGFSEPTVRGEGVSPAVAGPSVHTAESSRPLRSAGKMPTVFIFHLSLQEVGVTGGG